MKKELLLVVLLSVIPFIFIFSTSAFFYTQDGWTHLARGGAFYKALADGQFPVRWAADLNYGYGMPLFNFVFHMPYYVMSIFIFLGLGLVTALKITTLVSFVFSGVFMYLFAREFFKDEKKALLVTIFYQFFPFHLVDMFVRGSIGEMFAFTFLPVVLYGAALFLNKPVLRGLLFIAFGTAGLVLSHLATGAVFLAISSVFILLFSDSFKKTGLALLSMLLGLGVSAYYWLPAVLDHKYTYGSLFAKDLYTEHFVPFFNFFIPNFFNTPTLRIGDVPIQVGLFHTIGVLVALWFLFIAKKAKQDDKKLIWFCLIILVGAFFIMQPVSLFVWENVPLFEQFQFPWRFLGTVGFVMSLLAVFFLSLPYFKKLYLFAVLLFLVIGTSAVYWYPQLGFRTIDENEYWNYPLDTTYFGETNLVWSAGPASSYPKQRVEVIGGDAKVANIQKKSQQHTYDVIATKESQIVDHTQYYPGWEVLVNGQSVEIQFQDAHHRGELTYFVPPGKHHVEVVLSETKTRMLADVISIASLVFIFLLLVGKKLSNKFLKRFAV